VDLPRGIGLVRVRENGTQIVLVSSKLTHDEKIAAKVLAVLAGEPFILLTIKEITAALTAAL
jgi:hypothetical protein